MLHLNRVLFATTGLLFVLVSGIQGLVPLGEPSDVGFSNPSSETPKTPTLDGDVHHPFSADLNVDAEMREMLKQKFYESRPQEKEKKIERKAQAAQTAAQEMGELQEAVAKVISQQPSDVVVGLAVLEDLVHDIDHSMGLLHAGFFPHLVSLLPCKSPSQIASDWPFSLCSPPSASCLFSSPVCGWSQPCGFMQAQAALVLGSAAQNKPVVSEWFCRNGAVSSLLSMLAFPGHSSVARRALYALSCLVRSHSVCAEALAKESVDGLFVQLMSESATVDSSVRDILTSKTLRLVTWLSRSGSLNATSSLCERVGGILQEGRGGVEALEAALALVDAATTSTLCLQHIATAEAMHSLQAFQADSPHDDLAKSLVKQLLERFQRRPESVSVSATQPKPA